MKLFKKDQSPYFIALLFSVVIHFFLFSFWYIQHGKDNDLDKTSSAKNVATSKNTIKLDSIKMISQKQLLEIKNNSKKQIVANELNGKKEKPKNSRFAGEADQTFDRQTMAQNDGTFREAGLGNKDGAKTNLAQAPKVKQNKPKAQKSPESSTSAKPFNLSDFGIARNFKIDHEKNIEEKINEQNDSKSEEELAALGLERGNPNSSGLASSNDFVEDVPLGDMTNLNTTEFKYYGFYHRIRQKLEQFWGSSIQTKARNLYKSGRRIPTNENLITAITVTLDDKGNIVDIKIEGTSGIRELDQAAIESFNKAGPFPNPPKGLLVGGRAIIQWGFVVKS